MVKDLLLFVDCGSITGMSHRMWIFFSGFMWGVVGCLLLYKGLQFLAAGVDSGHSDRALWLIGLALFVGFLKGRFVLRKTVQRMSLHIMSLKAPIQARDVYPKSYWLLLASMMALGFLLRLVPLEVRGFVDVAVGSALINGAMLYFQVARARDPA